MADDDILVSIAANIEQLLAGFQQAADTVGASMTNIETHVSTASASIEGKLSPAAERATESLHRMQEESEGVGGAFENMSNKLNAAMEFTGLAIVVEAIKKIKEEMDELSERAVEFSHLGESLGIGAVALQGLEAAANESGVSTSRLERVMFQLQQRMDEARQKGGEAAQEFNRLGVSNTMLGDSTTDVIKIMEQLGNETNSNSELIGLLGARGAIVIPMLRELAQNHEAVAEGAQKVNALLPSEIAAMQEYHATISTVTEQLENFLTCALIPMVPVIQEAITEFEELTESGSVAAGVFSGMGEALRIVATLATGALYSVKVYLDAVSNAFLYVLDSLRTEQKLFQELVHGQFGDMVKTAEAGTNLVKQDWRNMTEQIVSDVDRGDAAMARMMAAMSGLSEVHPSLQREEMPQQKAIPQDDSEYRKNMEERARLKTEIINQEIKEDEDYLQLQIKMANDAAKAQMDAVLGSIQQQEFASDEIAKHEEFGYTRQLDIYKNLINQKLAAQIAYFNAEEALAAADGKDTEKYEEEKTKATQAAALDRVKAEQKAADEIRKTWDGIFKPIESSFTDNITKMIEGTESFGQAWRNILSSILDAFIKTSINMVSQWLFGMLENMLVTKTTAMSQICQRGRGSHGGNGQRSGHTVCWLGHGAGGCG